MSILQAILWITELCDVLTKTQVEAVQPNADIDALNVEQQKFERTAHVRYNISLLYLSCLDDIILYNIFLTGAIFFQRF